MPALPGMYSKRSGRGTPSGGLSCFADNGVARGMFGPLLRNRGKLQNVVDRSALGTAATMDVTTRIPNSGRPSFVEEQQHILNLAVPNTIPPLTMV